MSHTDHKPVEGTAPSAHVSTTVLPSVASTVVITLLFGIFGIIPAAINSGKATSLGLSTKKYWKAFWLTIVIQFALGFVAVAVLVVLAHFATQGQPNPFDTTADSNQSVSQDAGQPTDQANSPSSPPSTDGEFVLPPRPALNDYKGYVQWFENVIIQGLKTKDTRYFDAAIGSSSSQLYQDTLYAMNQNATNKVVITGAVITNFKLVSYDLAAGFEATYVVTYQTTNGTLQPQHETITAVWSAEYQGYILHSSVYTN